MTLFKPLFYTLRNGGRVDKWGVASNRRLEPGLWVAVPSCAPRCLSERGQQGESPSSTWARSCLGPLGSEITCSVCIVLL